MVSRRYKTWLWLALGLLTFGAVCFYSPVRALFDEVFLTQVFSQLGILAAPVFVLTFTIATTFGFPGNVMTVAAGAIFGLVWGTVWSVIGATLGATGAFWLARYALRHLVTHHFGSHPLLRRLNGAIAHQPFNFVLFMRFTPLSPFSLVNFLFGLTPVTLKTYMAGTFFGIIPLSIAYAWLGVTGKQAMHGGSQLPFLLAITCLAILSVVPMLGKKPVA